MGLLLFLAKKVGVPLFLTALLGLPRMPRLCTVGQGPARRWQDLCFKYLLYLKSSFVLPGYTDDSCYCPYGVACSFLLGVVALNAFYSYKALVEIEVPRYGLRWLGEEHLSGICPGCVHSAVRN